MTRKSWHSRVLVLAVCVGASACAAQAPVASGAVAAISTPSEPPSATSPQPSSPATSPQETVALSNELTLTTWAYSEGIGAVYATPDTHSKRIATAHLQDPDGFRSVYVLLSSYVDGEGREWVEARIPGRPNGRVGWMPRELLSSFHHTSWRIVVRRGKRRMSVYYAGHLLRVFPVGVGKPSTPTPVGHFWVDERFKLSNPSSPYWPYALGTSDYSTLPNWPGEGVIGIHGPYGEPQKIPGDPSHGCIRMLASDIEWLGPRVTLGTPVDVVP
jgi:L,D-transpeptidase catalytic domain